MFRPRESLRVKSSAVMSGKLIHFAATLRKTRTRVLPAGAFEDPGA